MRGPRGTPDCCALRVERRRRWRLSRRCRSRPGWARMSPVGPFRSAYDSRSRIGIDAPATIVLNLRRLRVSSRATNGSLSPDSSTTVREARSAARDATRQRVSHGPDARRFQSADATPPRVGRGPSCDRVRYQRGRVRTDACSWDVEVRLRASVVEKLAEPLGGGPASYVDDRVGLKLGARARAREQQIELRGIGGGPAATCAAACEDVLGGPATRAPSPLDVRYGAG